MGTSHPVPRQTRDSAVLNLLASALRWTSLVYIDASVVERMVTGLELTFSVVAARILRRRMVARSIWGECFQIARYCYFRCIRYLYFKYFK